MLGTAIDGESRSTISGIRTARGTTTAAIAGTITTLIAGTAIAAAATLGTTTTTIGTTIIIGTTTTAREIDAIADLDELDVEDKGGTSCAFRRCDPSS